MKRRNVKRFIALFCLLAVCAAIVYVRSHIETIGDRQRVAKTIQTLKSQFEANPADTDSLDSIITYLNGRWSFAATYAAGTLGQLGPKAARAIPSLVRALNCGDIFVEREAAIAIGRIGVGMQEVVDPLRRKIHNPKGDAAIFAAESLGNIGKPALAAIPDLEQETHSRFEWMRDTAHGALKKLKSLQSE